MYLLTDIKKASENVVGLIRLLQLFATSLTDISVETNSVDSDQTAPRSSLI